MSNLQISIESKLGLSFPATQEARWYAIHTRSRFEKRSTELLQEKQIFTFLPLLLQLHRWSDRWRKVEVPAFSCYAFVKIVATPETRVRVLNTPGVAGFVGREGLGAAIPDEQIESLRTVFREKIPCTVHPFLSTGSRVRIRGGALHGIEGILIGQNQDRSLVVSVELLGRSLSIRAEGYDLEPIRPGAPRLAPASAKN